VLDYAADLISRHAPDGTCRWASPAARRVLGYEPAQLAGAQPFAHVVAEDAPLLAEAAQQARREGRGVACFRARRADDEVVWLETTLAPAGDDLVAVTRDVSERKATELDLAHRALHDTLTGLPNRALFGDRLALALRRRVRGGTGTVAVFFLDVDRFKLVNDSLGHDAGDALLLEVAARLEAAVRPADTVARMGGDEFTVLCEDVAGELEAVAIAQRVVDLFAEPFSIAGREVYATTSVGVALASGRAGRAQDLLRDADAAMYRAKERGKARFELFDAPLREHALRRLELETELRRALRQDRLVLHFQPEVAVDGGAVTGYEALVRWDHPTRGLLDAAEFLPLAEETGLIGEIGAWALREACAAAARDGFAVSANVAAREIVDPGFVGTVAAALDDAGLAAEALCLEIGERAITAETVGTLRELAALGVRIALDDFGAAAGSLALLRDCPIDVVKLHSALDGAVAAAVVGLARALGLQTVAEGVEREDQLAALPLLGYDRAQGFLLGAPGPAPAPARAAA
jgi:diguanylate cyclase (GGDEF)-like protein/PAS domain S-box-containing protein